MAIATSTVSSETMGSAASTLLNTRKYSLICYSSYKEKILIGKGEKNPENVECNNPSKTTLSFSITSIEITFVSISNVTNYERE